MQEDSEDPTKAEEVADADNLPAIKQEREAELEYWTSFLAPIGVETCPFRITPDDFSPNTTDLKPSFEQLSPRQRVLILDALCQWNISTERKAICDSLRLNADGTPFFWLLVALVVLSRIDFFYLLKCKTGLPSMRMQMLGHDEVYFLHSSPRFGPI